MGYLEDITKFIKDGSKYAKDAKSAFDKNRPSGSIAKKALNGTLQFPCLVSNSIPIDMASTLAKTFERVYASFIQTYLSLNSTVDISVDKNPSDFLKKIHKNIKLESTELDMYVENCFEADEDFDNLLSRIYNGTTKAYINENENKMIVFNLSEKLSPEVFHENKDLLEELLKEIDFKPFPNIGNSPFYEGHWNGDTYIPSTLREVRDNIVDNASSSLIGNVIGAVRDAGRAAWDQNRGPSNVEKWRNDQDFKKTELGAKLKGNYDLRNEVLTADKFVIPQILNDQDVKKANEMQPYLMQVRLMAVNDENEFVQFMDFIVGIKVVLHPIKSDEMITNLQRVMQNNNKFFNFIRWTTGEKAFFKDFLFDIKNMKLDVANRSMGASSWWNTLKRLKDRSNYTTALFNRNQMIPNATMIITSFEVDALREDFGMDLRNVAYAIKLMQSLFLMSFVIVNNDTRTVEILYEGERAYQTYALETLEREVTLNSNKVGRELTRMISR